MKNVTVTTTTPEIHKKFEDGESVFFIQSKDGFEFYQIMKLKDEYHVFENGELISEHVNEALAYQEIIKLLIADNTRYWENYQNISNIINRM